MKIQIKVILSASLLLLVATTLSFSQKAIYIQPTFTYMDARTMTIPPAPGDTLKIVSGRVMNLKFKFLAGTSEKPIVIINSGGQVNISTTAWGALSFENCMHIKVTGTGDKNFRYGFKLQGIECGLSFSEYSSDCEAEFIEILGSGDTFFGIYAKKDFGGVPPVPYPQFKNLRIHDNYIHDVTEGMYIGETKSPGMEFRQVSIYNNIVENTGREAVQLANCVEDIEVHHNLFRNSGSSGETYQSNCLQIGGNTVGKYHHNILMNAPGYGVIILGTGNIEFYSNYLDNSIGAFIDDRYWPTENAPISLTNNYFRTTTGAEVVKNMNQYNFMYFLNNRYDTPVPFLNNAGGTPPVLENIGNELAGVKAIQFSVTEGVFSLDPVGPEEYIQFGPSSPPPPVSGRILLEAAMITDLVKGGSLNPPRYLVDEQELNPDSNQHPTSLPWKPAKNLKSAPFHLIIDLGAEYLIDRISLHDQSTSGNLIVSHGTPENWITLFIDPATKAKTWSNQVVRISTRYIRLSMSNLEAKINEIAIFGYAMIASSMPSAKASNSTDVSKPGSLTLDNQLESLVSTFRVYPNPVQDLLYITPLTEGAKVELIGADGKVVQTGKTGMTDTSGLPQGAYFLRITSRNNHLLHQEIIIKGR
jgi:hypothetical protein